MFEHRMLGRRELGLLILVVLATIPIFPYEWHLLLHIVGAVLFLGNIVVSALWMVLSERFGTPDVLKFSAKTVAQADRIFTVPGVVLVLGNGLVLTVDRWGGWSKFHEHSWITMGLLLFGLSGIVWVAFLLPLQSRLIQVSSDSKMTSDDKEFKELLHRWYVWGIVATVLPLISLYLMVAKPQLW